MKKKSIIIMVLILYAIASTLIGLNYYLLNEKNREIMIIQRREIWQIETDIKRLKVLYYDLMKFQSHTEYSLNLFDLDEEWRMENISRVKNWIEKIFTDY